MLSQNVKGILSLIGAISILLVLGSLYVWGGLVGYYASYLRKNGNPDISVVDIFFLMPITTFFCNLFMGGCSYLYHKLGIRIMAFISVTGTVLAHVLLVLVPKLFLAYIAMIIFGMSIPFFYLPSLHNLWKYFPNRKGMISGFALCSFGLSASILNILAQKIINPEGLPSDSNGLFPDEVADNCLTFLIVITIAYAVLGTIGLILTFPYVSSEVSDSDDLLQSLRESSESNTPKEEEPLMFAFKTRPFILICILCFTTMFYPYMISNTCKTFGDINKIDEGFLTMIVSCFSFLNGGLRILWGVLLDKVSFKFLYATSVVLGLIASSTVYFIGGNSILYFIAIILSGFNFAGHTAMMPAVSSRIFGLKNSTTVYGIATIFSGLTAFLGPVLAHFIVTSENDYLFLYMSGAGLLIVSLVVLYLLPLEKINYPQPKWNKNTNYVSDINLSEDARTTNISSSQNLL